MKDQISTFSKRVFNRILYKDVNRFFSLIDAPELVFASDYPRIHGDQWHCVYAARPNSRPHPRYFGSLRIDMMKKLDEEMPAAGVLELYGATVLGQSGWIFDNRGAFYPDFSWFGKHVDEISFIPRLKPRGTSLRGVSVSLATDFGVGSYGHFVYDVITRLHLFYKAGFLLDEVDHIICPKPTKGHAEFLLKTLGLPEEKMVWIEEHACLRPDKLLALSFPGTRRNYPKWMPRFLQESFMGQLKVPKKSRLFVTRKGYFRNPSNLQEVEALLAKFGFETYDPVTNPKAHLDFHQAEFVVGGSGSNLTGLVFCQPGTKVLELMSEDHVYPYYFSVCDSADLNYACLPCKCEKPREEGAWGPSLQDFHVDLIELENAVIALLNE